MIRKIERTLDALMETMTIDELYSILDNNFIDLPLYLDEYGNIDEIDASASYEILDTLTDILNGAIA